jgi:hypothetical protein
MAWKQCEYIHPNGRVCQGPAMRQTTLCYHHRRRRLKPASAYIPPLTDPHKVQVALTEVLRGMLTNRISDKEAGRLLYGIQTAIVMEHKKLDERQRVIDMKKQQK